ncbi:MAG: hypothetical protein KKH34_07470, partial [Candidatus Omnitrophica bacterium]|nr:hypothetical protein [Candidatus Omnitrophota bacterium]
SSALYAAQNILSKKLSLLFGNFETIMIHPFDNINAKRFAEKELDNFEIDEVLVNFLTYFTGGYPFYLDVIIEQIKCACLDNNTKTITEKILIESLEECMHKNHGKLNQYFQNKYHAFLSTNSNNLYPAVLPAIAGGRKKLSQISSFLNKKTHEINRLLAKLIQTDIITKKGVFHYINDPLFVHWLKYVLCRQQNSFNMDIYGAADKFGTEVKKLIDEFISESQKKIEQRLKELFESFENDIIELDNKRFMLTRFDEVVISNGNNSSLINAKRLNKSWLCGIEKDYIDEIKINDFLSQAKRRDCIKKILIALEGIDVNARLKALDAKVWVWDQKILNDMFFLFERPRFIK